MKKSKSLGALLLALVMCITLLPVPAVMADGASLTSISVGSDTQVVIAGTTAYTFNNVPVMYPNGTDQNAAVLPAIAAVVANPAYTFEVSTPVISGTVATVTIAVSNGDNYSLTLNLIGTNVYTNGGFESSTTSQVKNIKERTSAVAHRGTYSVISETLKSWNRSCYYDPMASVAAGKTYLSSLAGMLSDGYAENPANFLLGTERSNNLDLGNSINKFYQDGELLGDGWSKSASAEKGKWHLYDFVTTIAVTDAQPGKFSAAPTNSAATNLNLYLDDYFMGELIVADVELSANGATIPATIETDPSQEKVYTVAAKAVNQVGTVSGLEGATLALSLDAGATGATLTDGTLTIPVNADGTITLTATVTPDWSGALQTSYVKKQEIKLVKEKALSELIVGGTPIDLANFDPENHIKVPAIYESGVETVKLPAIYAKAKTEGNTVVVSTPVISGNTATATVTVMNGASTVESYALTMDIIGTNLYENGGFEAAENTKVKAPKNANHMPWRDRGNAHSGYYMIKADVNLFNWVGYYYIPVASITAGKTYLSSLAGMLSDENVSNSANFLLYAERSNNLDSNNTSNKFYRDGALLASGLSASTAMEKGIWHHYDAVTTTTENGEFSSVLTNTTATKYAALFDDYFMGELVIGGAKLTATEGEVAKTIYTGAGNKVFTGVTAAALNQIGTASGMENTTTTLELVEKPAGVSYADGTLTISENATGTITFKATVTPTDVWTDAQQTAYVEYITIDLFNTNEITQTKDGSTVTVSVKYGNETGAAQPIAIYYAVYVSETNVKSVEPVYTAVANGAVYEVSKNIAVEQGETVKCFLWENGTFKPLIAK